MLKRFKAWRCRVGWHRWGYYGWPGGGERNRRFCWNCDLRQIGDPDYTGMEFTWRTG